MFQKVVFLLEIKLILSIKYFVFGSFGLLSFWNYKNTNLLLLFDYDYLYRYNIINDKENTLHEQTLTHDKGTTFIQDTAVMWE